MKLYVGVTDNEWFSFHAARHPDEVNFWRPGGREESFAAIQEGEPFLFKLHSPLDFIVGGGFFVSHSRLSLSTAWRFFGEKNGFSELAPFRERILRIRKEEDVPGNDPVIGCTILALPFFLPRNKWISAPNDWASQIVRGKTYDATSGEGKRIWDWIFDLLPGLPGYLDVGTEIRKRGPLYVVEGRQGQGAFRTRVLDAYTRRCAISGERTEPVLEASHIMPYRRNGPNKVNNGILMRSDIHQLFDAGLITVTKDYHVEVSRKIKELYDNGREYYRFHGEPLRLLPSRPEDHPDRLSIVWHNEHVYQR